MGKGLNDAIHGDRAKIRGYTPPKEKTWDEWLNSKNDPKPSAGFAGDYFKGATSYANDAKGAKAGYVSCYHSHPPLKLPGTELVIYGGSCSSPVVKDADIYIRFDAGMLPSNNETKFLPDRKDIFYRISDMRPPTNPKTFAQLVDWTGQQLADGKKVHCGCIGGHGRTGTFLAALVSRFGESDAIAYVRKNYCKKVVESSDQVKFLGAHFGVKAAAHTKEYETKPKKAATKFLTYSSGTKQSQGREPIKFTNVSGNGCIWG
jgi:hypothetical protein